MFPEMYPLLAILIAVAITAKIDCNPIGFESGADIAAIHETNQQGVISSDKNQERENVIPSEREPLDFQGSKNMSTSGMELKPRKLDESETTGNKAPNWGKKITKKARNVKETIASKVSDCLKPSEESEHRNWLRQRAINMLKELHKTLLKQDSDPIKDRQLSNEIDYAFYLYHTAFNLEVPLFPNVDSDTRLKLKLEKLQPIFDNMEAGKDIMEISCKKTRSAPGTIASKILDWWNAPAEEGNQRILRELQQKIYLRQRAIDRLKELQKTLSNPDADPFKNKKLGDQVDYAFYLYHTAFNLDLPLFPNVDPDTRLKLKLEKLRLIFDEINAGKEIMETSSKKAVIDAIVPKVPDCWTLSEESEQQNWLRQRAVDELRALHVALLKPRADPYNDYKLVDQIHYVFYLYHVAFNFDVPLFPNTDPATCLKLKLEILQPIFDDLEAGKDIMKALIHSPEKRESSPTKRMSSPSKSTRD